MATPQQPADPAIVRALLNKAVKKFGSQKRFGEKCGVKQQTISRAIASGKVSIELALYIHRATRGAVNRVVICPELRGLL